MIVRIKGAAPLQAKVFAKRQNGLDPPIQMRVALARNFSEEFQAILANCLIHGRRNFIDIADNFPDECLYVLETLGKVYHHETITAPLDMTPTLTLAKKLVKGMSHLNE